MVTITFNTRFKIEFKAKISDVKDIEKILKYNKYESTTLSRLPFDNWVKFVVPVTICKAYALKQLLKNYKYIQL